MALDLPRTLSPSKVSAFTSCPLAFRYSQIEHLPEPPSPYSVKGTLVHAALEGLFWHHGEGHRSHAAAEGELERVWAVRRDDPEYAELHLDGEQEEAFFADACRLIDNYFLLEDPDDVHTIGVEIGVETVVDGMRLRGIIDRLDIAPDGSLIVVDYKTGRTPSERFERGGLGGVQTYALLCESMLGRAPVEVRLLYLREPIAICAQATPQTITGQRRRAVAVWSAISRACNSEDFRPRVGPLCDYCNFRDLCPAFAA